jgi:hypothetical protein
VKAAAAAAASVPAAGVVGVMASAMHMLQRRAGVEAVQLNMLSVVLALGCVWLWVCCGPCVALLPSTQTHQLHGSLIMTKWAASLSTGV